METRVNYVRNSFDVNGTVALELPSKVSLINMVTNQISMIIINTGIAILHPKERFVKKIGRKMAMERLNCSDSKRAFHLESIIFERMNPGRLLFTFISEESVPTIGGPNVYVKLLISTYKDSDKSRLLATDLVREGVQKG